MPTKIQGDRITELKDKGWKQVWFEEDMGPLTFANRGAPAKIVSPNGWIFNVMDNGTLESLDMRLLNSLHPQIQEVIRKEFDVV
jgi:hypothetical protein